MFDDYHPIGEGERQILATNNIVDIKNIGMGGWAFMPLPIFSKDKFWRISKFAMLSFKISKLHHDIGQNICRK